MFTMLANSVDNGTSWLLPVIMIVFIVLLILTSVIPQKKRQKQMMNMLSNLKAGDEIKTIGGMIGKITQIDDATGIITINVGTESAPTFINIDKVAIYSVAPAPVAEVAPAQEVAPLEEATPVEEVKEENK